MAQLPIATPQFIINPGLNSRNSASNRIVKREFKLSLANSAALQDPLSFFKDFNVQTEIIYYE